MLQHSRVHLGGRTNRPSPRWRARRGMTDRWTLRHALYPSDPRARGDGGDPSNHQLPIRRVDSWKHGSRSKISGPASHPRLALTWPRHGHALGYFDRERERRKREERAMKEGGKKGNNNNRSLRGTSWSRARSSSWNSSTARDRLLLQKQSARVRNSEFQM